MLDGYARKRIDPLLNEMGVRLAATGVTANTVTVLAWIVGMAGALCIARSYFVAGLMLILLSRIGDGLDGAVARTTRPTEFGGYLDIVLDFVFYGAVPLGFVVADPVANGLAGAALLFSFYVNGASFLAYAAVAERIGLSTDVRGGKSIYFTTGLAEATETYIAFAAACIFPARFAPIAWVFAVLCIYTAVSRIVLAGRVFRATAKDPS